MVTVDNKQQLTLNFDAGLATAYNSCREYLQTRIHQLGKQQKYIAADMGYSPSDLSRKLAQNESDSRRLTLDDFEKYLDTQKDYQPLIYLVEKYFGSGDTEDELAARIEADQRKLQEIRSRRAG